MDLTALVGQDLRPDPTTLQFGLLSASVRPPVNQTLIALILLVVDDTEWSRAEATNLAAAKEEAARKVLRMFRFKNITNTSRFVGSS